MALYHKAAYTLEPEATVVDAAPLSVGNTEAEADTIVGLSAGYGASSKITSAVVLAGKAATITLTPATALKPGYRVTWTWGDGLGQIERGPDLVQTHTYLKAGAYTATAYIFQDGLPTLDIDVLVLVP